MDGRHRIRACACLFVSLALWAIGCQPKSNAEQDERIRICATMCTQPACDGATELDPATVDMCTTLCVDKTELVEDVSEACGDAYSTSVDCVAALSCESFMAFAQGASHPCEGELRRFEETCEDLEFLFVD